MHFRGVDKMYQWPTMTSTYSRCRFDVSAQMDGMPSSRRQSFSDDICPVAPCSAVIENGCDGESEDESGGNDDFSARELSLPGDDLSNP